MRTSVFLPDLVPLYHWTICIKYEHDHLFLRFPVPDNLEHDKFPPDISIFVAQEKDSGILLVHTLKRQYARKYQRMIVTYSATLHKKCIDLFIQLLISIFRSDGVIWNSMLLPSGLNRLKRNDFPSVHPLTAILFSV